MDSRSASVSATGRSCKKQDLTPLLHSSLLTSRLSRGPLPPEQVLRVATEIASALAAAHRRAVVHRDLKPGNVMLTRAGARLLDFGLAKPSSFPAPELPAEATLTAPITAGGTLVGTVPYMSPEQVEGREIDARSDIFSFGAVLYEMATGRRAFGGKTTASLIAAILERDPAPVSSLQPLAPAGLDDIVRGCLAKDPEDRWQTAHDVKLQLDSLQRRVGTGVPVESIPGVLPPTASARGRVGRIMTMFGLVAAGAAALLFWPRADAPWSSAAATPLVRAPLPPPRGHAFLPNNSQISPDGSRVAFIAAGADGVSALWTTSLATGHDTPIVGTEGATGPFWSPDSRWIGFFARGRLLKVEPGGAGIREICPVPFNAGFGAWAPNDEIVFSGSVLGPLLRVPSSGGAAVEVTRIPKDMPGETHRFPQFLADGQRFLYLASWTNQQRGVIYLGSLSGGDDTPDGQRFLINSLPRDDAGAPLTLLVNWIRSLER